MQREQTAMYSFEDIELRRLDGKYIIIVGGKPEPDNRWSEDQLRNPFIAEQRFVNCISDRLRERITAYLYKQGLNSAMGCNIDMPCNDCRAYSLDTEGSNCPYRE